MLYYTPLVSNVANLVKQDFSVMATLVFEKIHLLVKKKR